MLTIDLTPLKTLVQEVAADLPKVSVKRMFGCDGFFANDAIFALIWKEGRIGVRLPDAAAYESLLGHDGATRWKAGNMTMSHWVLVPRSFHSRSGDLARWVRAAHALAGNQKPAKKGTASRRKKTAAAKASAGRKAPKATGKRATAVRRPRATA